MASTSSRNSGGAGEAALIPLGSHAGSPPIPLKRPATLFGSRKDAVRVHLESSTVSKVHCVIVKNDWGCYVHDLGSRSHTLVNGKPVDDIDLHDGDQVTIGRFQFKYSYTPGPADDERLIAPPAELGVSTLSDPLPLDKRVLVIGRRENADLVLDDRSVSNIHSIVFEHNGKHQIRDIASRTGTWLAGRAIHQELLTPGSGLKIGPVRLTYSLALPGASSAPAAAADDAKLNSAAPILLHGSSITDAPIDIDAKSSELDLSDADLDDLLDLAPDEDVAPAPAAKAPIPAPAKPASPKAVPAAREPVAPPKVKPAPAKPTPIAPEPIALEPLELEPVEPAPLVSEAPVSHEPAAAIPPAAESLADAVDEEPDGQPSEDGLASLRRDWLSPVKADDEIELISPASEAPAEIKSADEAVAGAEQPADDSIESLDLGLELELDDEPATTDQKAIAEADVEEDVLALEPPAPAESADVPPAAPVSLSPLSLTPLTVEDEAPEDDVAPALEVPADAAPAEIEEDDHADIAAVDEPVVVPEAEAPDIDVELELPVAPDEAEAELAPLADSPAAPRAADVTAPAPAAPVDRPPKPEPVAEAETEIEAEADVEPEPLPLADVVTAKAEPEPLPEPLAIDEPDEAPAEPVAVSDDDAEAEPPLEYSAQADDAIAEEPEPDLDLAPIDLDGDVEAEAEAEIEAAPALDLTSPVADEAKVDEPVLEEPALDLEPIATDDTALPVTAAAAATDDGPDLDFDVLALDEEDDAETPAVEACAADAPAEASVVASVADSADAEDETDLLSLDEEPEESITPAAPVLEASDEAELDLDALIADEADEEEEAVADAPAIDLSAARFDEAAVAEDEDAEEPTPISELEGVDFSHLQVETPSTPAADIAAAGPIVHDEHDTLIGETYDDSATARPLINLADSISGVNAAADTQASADDFATIEDEIEVIEETRPSPESAMPDTLDELDLDLDLEADALETDAPAASESTAINSTADTAVDVEGLDFDEPPQAEQPPARPNTGPVPKLVAEGPSVPNDDIPEPQGGSLNDLIPAGGPLIGGTFGMPPPSTLIGGSPVVVPNEPPKPPAGQPPQRRRPLRLGGNEAKPGSPFATGTERTIADVLIGRRGTTSVDVFANPSPTPEDLQLAQEGREQNNQGQDPNAGHPGDVAGEFAPAAPEPDEAAHAEEGPGPTDRDQPVPPSAELSPEEIAGQDLTAEEREILELAEQYRPRGQIRPVQQFPQPAQPPPTAASPEIPPVYRPGDEPDAHAAARRKRIGRVFLCLALMGTLIPAALFAIHKYLAPVSKVDAMITFAGLEGRKTADAQQFRGQQTEHLFSERTRQYALSLLDRSIPFGFLDSTQKVLQTVDRDPETLWSSNQPSQMRLRMLSRQDEKENDRVRLRALAQAVINASEPARQTRQDLESKTQKERHELGAKLAHLNNVKADLEGLRQLEGQRLTPEQVEALQIQRKQAEDELRQVKANRQELEAAIERLQRQAAPAPAAPVQSGAEVAKADAEIAKLNQQLADLQKQNEAVKVAVDQKAAAARKQLDAVIAQLESDLSTAQKLKDNPELQRYVEAANRHFKETRQLTEQLIGRLEKQRTQISEVKQQISDKIDARQKELLEKDADLKQWNDTLAIQTRKLNAANAQGVDDPAEKAKIEGDMQLIRSLIGAREELHKSDPVYNGIIAQLQGVIDQIEQGIQADRKQADLMLTKAQEDFAKSAPAVEKLPAEQKALAEALDKKMAAVNEARRAYDATAETAQAEQAKLEASLKERMAALQVEIAARRSDLNAAAEQKQFELAAAERAKELAATKASLDEIRQQEGRVQAKLDDRTKSVQDAVARNASFAAIDAKRIALEAQRGDLERDIQKINAWLKDRTAEMADLIVPAPRPEIESYDAPDQRPTYMTIAGGGLLALLLIPLVWNLLLLSRDAHHGTAAFPMGGTITGGYVNGHAANGHAHALTNGHAADLDNADVTRRNTNGFDPIFPADPALEEETTHAGTADDPTDDRLTTPSRDAAVAGAQRD